MVQPQFLGLIRVLLNISTLHFVLRGGLVNRARNSGLGVDVVDVLLDFLDFLDCHVTAPNAALRVLVGHDQLDPSSSAPLNFIPASRHRVPRPLFGPRVDCLLLN